MILYQFRYLYCIYEGSWNTVSIHKTKKGAYMAMRKFLLDRYQDWDKVRRAIGYTRTDTDKVSHHDLWNIKSIELKD